MESERKETVGAEGLPAAVFADGEWSGAAAVMEDEGLVVVIKVTLNRGEERVGKIAVFEKILAIFEINNGGLHRGGRFGFLGESNEGVVGAGEMIIGNERRGGAEEVGNFELAGDETGETDGGIFGGIFLEIGGFVGFVNDDETEIIDGGKKSGAGADDDARLFCLEDVLPGEVALSFGELRVEEDDLAGEMLLENSDELRGEGDFGNEQNSGFLLF